MNFLKVVPLWAITGAMSHDASKGPRGGLPVLYQELLKPKEQALFVTRSVREWESGFVESTESMFKELMWELALEGK